MVAIRWAAAAVMMMSGAANATAMPSFSCVFTEPFIGIDVWPGGMRVATPERAQAVKAATLGGTAREPVVSTTVAGEKTTLAIRDKPGSDGMSDHLRPLTGLLTRGANAMPQPGACLRFPDGTTPRPVTGVGVADHLMVRASGNVRAAKVGELGSRGMFWAFPEPLVAGWARGAIERLPEGGTGQSRVVIGWVNARFLGTVAARD
jgi:hypothetical protein